MKLITIFFDKTDHNLASSFPRIHKPKLIDFMGFLDGSVSELVDSLEIFIPVRRELKSLSVAIDAYKPRGKSSKMGEDNSILNLGEVVHWDSGRLSHQLPQAVELVPFL